MKEIAEVKISKESEFDLKFEDGVVKALISYDGKGLDGGIYINMEPEYFLDKLAAAIPGEWDNKVIEMLKMALKL